MLLPIAGFIAWLLLPKALHMNIVEPKTEHAFRVGQHEIRIVVTPMVDGDNGAAMVQIYNGITLLGSKESVFNYDTLQNNPPAHVRYAWLDGDVLPDLLLELQSDRLYISSQSGKVVAL
ncbi:MAG: hypothetical protein RLZZ156_1130 [Deinococcota bacterium]